SPRPGSAWPASAPSAAAWPVSDPGPVAPARSWAWRSYRMQRRRGVRTDWLSSFSPYRAGLGRVHRCPRCARERIGELLHVAKCAVDPKLRRRTRIRLQTPGELGRALAHARRLRDGDEELLVLGVAVGDGIGAGGRFALGGLAPARDAQLRPSGGGPQHVAGEVVTLDLEVVGSPPVGVADRSHELAELRDRGLLRGIAHPRRARELVTH